MRAILKTIVVEVVLAAVLTTGCQSNGDCTSDCSGVAPNVDPACDACRSEACCREAQACVDDRDCQAWLACEDACAGDDIVCQNTCWSTLPAGRQKSAYMACRQRACPGICGPAECSEDYGYFDATDDACRACRNLHCCEEMVSCWHDQDCIFPLECFNTCTTGACMMSRCNSAEYQQFLAKLAPDWACRNRYCLAECDAECSVVIGYSNAACKLCANENCCEETRACSDDVECIEFFICNSGCGTAACREECEKRHWKGAGLNLVREYCLQNSCIGICGGPDRGGCGGLPYSNADCKTCMGENCCAEAEACGTNAECAGLFLCTVRCADDADCRDVCLANATAGGIPLFDALEECRVGSCASDCPVY